MIVKMLKNWITQGILYSEKREFIFRIIFELVLVIILGCFLYYLLNANFLSILLISFVFFHTIFWILSGQIWVIMRKYHATNPEKIMSFLYTISRNYANKNWIEKLFIVGSISRGELTQHSDIDLRIVPQSGFFNFLCAFFLSLRIKFIASIKRIPLEVYVFSMYYLGKIESNAVELKKVFEDA